MFSRSIDSPVLGTCFVRWHRVQLCSWKQITRTTQRRNTRKYFKFLSLNLYWYKENPNKSLLPPQTRKSSLFCIESERGVKLKDSLLNIKQFVKNLLEKIQVSPITKVSGVYHVVIVTKFFVLHANSEHSKLDLSSVQCSLLCCVC